MSRVQLGGEAAARAPASVFCRRRHPLTQVGRIRSCHAVAMADLLIAGRCSAPTKPRRRSPAKASSAVLAG